ncbi:MAG: RagB/SusD family nutrient uptake outer membrane protein [Bacteroidaceae bacterium]|jgi:hypothetical protein|nr:RagB/SusD family nutrient uptake outer membrane protein [Bacteroidaceae bacterium]
MKSFKNIYHTVCLAGLLTLGTSSCTDWLTIYPQDRVVEENFWEDKNDLEGVRYGAYRQMAQTVSKLAIWGDLRSDSYAVNSVDHSNQGNRDTYIEIMNGMPDSSMSVFDWGGVYTTINYCNKVLQHGEEVLARDKQFTTGEWIQMHAEMTALRALNYFYLLRAFKDIPYTTKVINKDSEVEYFPLTNQLVVLDSIIADCEKVKGKARNRFSKKADSKGMITNCAIYAMLADMYLWRGSLHEGRHGKTGSDIVVNADGEEVEVSHNVVDDYNKAVEYADLSLQSLTNQNNEEKTGAGLSSSSEETFSYGLTNCDMIKNNFEGAAQATTPKLEAHTAIFTRKNSRESIFELQYSVSDDLSNSVVNSLYGFSNGTHLMVNKDAIDALYNGGIAGTGDNGGMWDSRVWICCQNKLTTGNEAASAQAQSGYYCMKYALPSSDILNMDGSNNSREIRSVKYTSTAYNNWIIYRMTDVMLIKAEALACISNSNLKTVKSICNAIHRRSYCNFRESSKIPNTDATTEGTIGNTYASSKKAKNGVSLTDGIMYVMNERQIELIGEGKRWFDLVRLAERCSYSNNKSDPEDPREKGVTNGQSGMSAMIDMFLGTGANASYATTLTNRFKNRYGLYCPIYYMEVKASNGAIEQNPVWNKSKYEQ